MLIPMLTLNRFFRLISTSQVSTHKAKSIHPNSCHCLHQPLSCAPCESLVRGPKKSKNLNDLLGHAWPHLACGSDLHRIASDFHRSALASLPGGLRVFSDAMVPGLPGLQGAHENFAGPDGLTKEFSCQIVGGL